MPKDAETILMEHMRSDWGIERSDEAYVDDILPNMLPATQIFEVQQAPAGDAPEEIRQGWVGVELPVRAFMPSDYLTVTVPILAVDGLVVLARAGRQQAHDWWADFYEQKGKSGEDAIILGMLNPYAHMASYPIIARYSFLGFNRSEGELKSIQRSRV